jgi:N6-adenosine-specific RNA methylase IME4
MAMMNIEQPSLFDYSALDSDTRAFVQDKAQSIHARLKRTAEDIIAIGLDLIEVKARLAHGQFLPWLQSEFGMTDRHARNFMYVAQRFGNKMEIISDLSVTVLYELAAPSTPEPVVEMVTTGQIPATISAIREAKFAPAEQQPDWLAAAHAPIIEDIQREIKREQQRERIAQLKENGVSLPTGQYSCLVVDPPWPMQKIERDVRPNQFEFDYPTMSEDELRAFPLPDLAADDCHLYLWTTQKYLPMALRLAEHWGFKYQCLMTWVKNVGFTPFSWMYSTEHVLFCTRGSLPLLALGRRLDFSAKVREHSRKPDEFYDLVREVSPGPRMDVFSREMREGFEQYGNEVDKYVSA